MPRRLRRPVALVVEQPNEVPKNPRGKCGHGITLLFLKQRSKAGRRVNRAILARRLRDRTSKEGRELSFELVFF